MATAATSAFNYILTLRPRVLVEAIKGIIHIINRYVLKALGDKEGNYFRDEAFLADLYKQSFSTTGSLNFLNLRADY